jgi:hypothetical protein
MFLWISKQEIEKCPHEALLALRSPIRFELKNPTSKPDIVTAHKMAEVHQYPEALTVIRWEVLEINR